jgi:hypothetical protein
VIVHRLSTRRQRSQTSTSRPRTRIRLRLGRRRGKLSLYIERRFLTPKSHSRPATLTHLLQPAAGLSAAGQWRASRQRCAAGRLAPFVVTWPTTDASSASAGQRNGPESRSPV